jgi:SAM-dependent methyltransferase
MSNKCENYGAISTIYDKINSSVDYTCWADFFEKCFDKFLPVRPELVLDLACGTGSMTLELAKRGYDMIGVDGSADMLNVALDRKYDLELPCDVLFLLQDMREFELYGTVGAITCCLDSVNYLTEKNDLKKCFSLVHNYLDPDGLFLFDVNTPYKFENVYGSNSYVYEEDDCGEGNFCVWQNFYDKETKLCDFSLTVFEKNEGSTLYSRRDEIQSERCYSRDELEQLLTECGFEILGFYSDFDFTLASEKNERWYVVARAKKQ